MGTQKHNKSKNSNKRFRKTRSKRQRGGVNNNIRLIRSSMFGNKKTVEELLKEGANVNAKNSDGYTALILASSNGRTEIVEMLLDNGADVNAKDKYNATALIKASSNGHTEIVAKLLDAGADVNAKNDYGYTALIQASRNKHTEIVAMLLDNGADVNATDNDGETALMRVINCNEEDDRPWYQVEYDIIEIVEMLLAAGADVNVENNNKTALAIAEKTGCTKQIQNLIIKHIVAQSIPRHLERQEEQKQKWIDRKNLNATMAQFHVKKPYGHPRMHTDITRQIGDYLSKKPNDKLPAAGGKRRTRKSKRKGRKTRRK